MNARTSRLTSLTLCGALIVLAALWIGGGRTLGAFTSARIGNSADNVTSGQLAVRHAYSTSTCTADQVAPPTDVNCPASLYPAATTATGTTAGANDAITNTGTVPASRITSRYRVASCGPLQLANSVSGGTSGAMLPRTGVSFSPTSGPMATSGAVGFNGSTGYASSVGATTEPVGPAVIGATWYGLGVWFKTSSTSVSPLFGFGSNPLAVTATNDRILYLDAAGHIGFVVSTAVSLTVSTSTFNNGAWHFAYVVLAATRAVGGLAVAVIVYVDGNPVINVSVGLGALAAYSGYWHLGWSPIGGVGRYFNGSLSDFVVDDSGSAPLSPGANPTSYSSFDSTRTQQWPLDDSGGSFDGTTTTGTLPQSTALPSGARDPCLDVDATWASAGLAPPTTLRGAVTAGYRTAAASPGTLTSTISLSRDSVFDAYAVGLLMYAPVQATYSVTTAATWSLSFTWSASNTTFVIA